MRFVYKDRIGGLEFDSKSEFAEWGEARWQRARKRFPGEVEKLTDIGPTSVSRVDLDDDTQIAATFEKFKVRLDRDITALRIPLDREFSILQLEVRDSETGLTHLWNFGRRSDFDSVDERPVAASSRQSTVADEVDKTQALVNFGVAYAALGRSARFSIIEVPAEELKSTRRFAGYCPRCDGLLERTGLKVDEHDNETVLSEERCLDCDQRLLGWKGKGEGRVPPGWMNLPASTMAEHSRKGGVMLVGDESAMDVVLWVDKQKCSGDLYLTPEALYFVCFVAQGPLGRGGAALEVRGEVRALLRGRPLDEAAALHQHSRRFATSDVKEFKKAFWSGQTFTVGDMTYRFEQGPSRRDRERLRAWCAEHGIRCTGF